MDKHRLWVLGSVVAMVAIVALGLILGIEPQLKAAASAKVDRASVEAANAEQAAVVAQLKVDFAGIDALRAELAPLSRSVPTGTEIPAFITQLSELAAKSQVKLTGITTADAVAYAPIVGSAEEGGPAEAPADESAAADVEAAVPAGLTGTAPIVDPLITSSNFASLNMQITLNGNYDRILDFVAGLQSGERLFLVSGLTTAAVADAPAGTVDATISGLLYVIVPAAGEATPAAE